MLTFCLFVVFFFVHAKKKKFIFKCNCKKLTVCYLFIVSPQMEWIGCHWIVLWLFWHIIMLKTEFYSQLIVKLKRRRRSGRRKKNRKETKEQSLCENSIFHRIKIAHTHTFCWNCATAAISQWVSEQKPWNEQSILFLNEN